MNRDDAEEEADDVAIFDERMRDLKAGNDIPLPAEVSQSILKGDSVLLAVRRSKHVSCIGDPQSVDGKNRQFGPWLAWFIAEVRCSEAAMSAA